MYFTFLRPFAELAGVDLDWTVPRDSLDFYPLLELIDGAMPGGVEEETAETLPPALGPDAEPCEDRHGQLPAREPADGLGGKIGEVDLAGREREISRDLPLAVKKNLRH